MTAHGMHSVYDPRMRRLLSADAPHSTRGTTAGCRPACYMSTGPRVAPLAFDLSCKARLHSNME